MVSKRDTTPYEPSSQREEDEQEYVERLIHKSDMPRGTRKNTN
jgi:hypothetical protein